MGWRDREWWREGDDDADAQGDYEGSDLQELVELQRRGMVANTSAKQDYKTANWGKRIGPITASVPNGVLMAEVQSDVPRPWTVTVGTGEAKIVDGELGLLADHNDAFMVLEYGVGGAGVRVTVDVATGWSCTVYGSYVRVTYVLPTFIGLAASPPLTVTAFVCPGAQPRSQMLTRTVRYSDLAIGANESRRVPPFAERLWFQSEGVDTTNSAVRLEQSRLGFTQIVAALAWGNSTAVEPLAMLGGWPLSPDATAVRMTNISVANYVNPRMVYSLRF